MAEPSLLDLIASSRLAEIAKLKLKAASGMAGAVAARARLVVLTTEILAEEVGVVRRTDRGLRHGWWA